MKISYNWLKEYIKTDVHPKEMAEILTNTGLEVEGIEEFESVKGGLDGIIVGEVKSVNKHPNADKLIVSEVDLGKGNIVSIVCGATNVEVGQKVPVATIGTTLFSGEESFKIKRSVIRGTHSINHLTILQQVHEKHSPMNQQPHQHQHPQVSLLTSRSPEQYISYQLFLPLKHH